MEIKWCPLNVPWHRRWQTFIAGCWMMLILFGELFTLFLFVGLLLFGNMYWRAFCVIYFAFLYYDRRTGETGGRGQGSSWIRNMTFWKVFRDYFPVSLVKTAELTPDRNYLFGLFPHGLLSLSGFVNFNTNATTWQRDFPGIRSKLVTLGFHFYIPFYRELALAWGMSAASAKNLNCLLSWPNDKDHPKNRDGYTSTATVIVVGGAQEALYMRPGNYRIVLQKRKGFVKLALRNGTALVPVFSFGELDLFDQPANPPGSKLRRWQDFFKLVTGIAPTKFIGRGFFQYSFGMIPRRAPLITVVGKPIDLPKIAEPSQDEIDKYHQMFIDGLVDLFETHKSKYIEKCENVHLEIE